MPPIREIVSQPNISIPATVVSVKAAQRANLTAKDLRKHGWDYDNNSLRSIRKTRMVALMTLLFTLRHAEIFQRLSGDANPLHVDSNYARRTQFGQRIFYGMGSVLMALGAWAQGREFSLKTISAHFLKPILFDQDYDLEVSENDALVQIKILQNKRIHTRISFVWEKKLDLPKRPAISGVYGVNLSALPDLHSAFDLSDDQLFVDQLTALCWASYYVGMENPGKQALFSSLEMDFAPQDMAAKSPDPFSAQTVKATVDDRFNLVEMTGRTVGVPSFTIKAFKRPEPVDYPIAIVKDEIGQGSDFSSTFALVTGSSRGFGEVLAKALALRGAHVYLNSKSGSLESIAAEIHSLNLRASQFTGDLENPSMGANFVKREFEVDLLIHNACPPIESCAFVDQLPKNWLHFLTRSIDINLNLSRALIPSMKPGSTLVLISTAFLENPEPGFTHYLAAKAALEGCYMGLAREFPKLNFVVARCPRMLTDQTNTVIGREERSPISVAKALLEHLVQLPKNKNFHLFASSELGS